MCRKQWTKYKVSFTGRPQENIPRYCASRILCGLQSRSRRREGHDVLISLLGIDLRTLCCAPRTTVTILTGVNSATLARNVCLFLARQPSSGPWPPHLRGFQIIHNDAPQSVGLLWTSDQLVAEISTWQHKRDNRWTPMPPVGFEPTISASERPQTYASCCAATGTGCKKCAASTFRVQKWGSVCCPADCVQLV